MWKGWRGRKVLSPSSPDLIFAPNAHKLVLRISTVCTLPVGKMVNTVATAARQDIDSRRNVAAVEWFVAVINAIAVASR